MFYTKLLHWLGNILICMYFSEARRLNKLAVAESNSARKLAERSEKHLEVSAQLAAKAQKLYELVNISNKH